MYIARMDLSFQKTKEDDPKVPVGDPVIVEAGHEVPNWVPAFQVSALTNAGAIVVAADRESAVIPAAEEIPAQPRTMDQPVVLPSDPNGAPLTLADMNDAASASETATDAGSTSAAMEKPDGRASKATWEQYAIQVGVPAGEAESLSKTELQARVAEEEARQAAATSEGSTTNS
jgi:hypothetical protein